MVTDKATLAESAEAFVGMSQTEDFARRLELSQEFPLLSDAQSMMATLCLIDAGARAPERYDAQLALGDKVKRAVEGREMLVLGKGFDKDGTMLHAFVPTSEATHAVWIGHTHTDRPFIETTTRIATGSGDWANSGRIAHAYTYLGRDRGNPRQDKVAMRAFVNDGEMPILASSLGATPEISAAWIKHWASLSKERKALHLSEVSELDDKLIHGLMTLDEFRERFASSAHRWQDQLGVLSVLACAIEQAETGDLFTKDRTYFASSRTRSAGIGQFSADRNSPAVLLDLDQLVERANTMTPVTIGEGKKIKEEQSKAAAKERQELINTKLATLDVRLTSFDMDVAEGNAEDLETLYARAEEYGYFIYEFRMGEDDEHFNAVVGDQKMLDDAGVTVSDISFWDLAFTASIPSMGRTRELAVQRALDEWHTQKVEQGGDNPFGGRKSLYLTASEGDQLVKVFIPDTASQALEATAEVFTGDDEAPTFSFSIAMQDPPVFDVSERDRTRMLEDVAWHFIERERNGQI